MTEDMIQIGVTALRSPDGTFLPSVPLFIKVEDVKNVSNKPKKSPHKELTQDELNDMFIKKFRAYQKAVRKKHMSPLPHLTHKGEIK